MPEHEETTKINPWWLASTSFPALAGTLCAMALMFNICTVSQGWQEAVDVGGRRSRLSQPAWVIALKAVSLALATIAYLVFLLTMMYKRHPTKGFSVAIMGWLAAATILFSLIGIVAQEDPIVQPQETVEFTQNFFYGIIAAGLYVLVAILLAIYTASAHSVRLSHKDRQTVECTSVILRSVAFMVFLLGGAAVYSPIEGWSFMDALYFTDYTLLTIGIGNLVPKTHLGRSLLFIYVPAGTISLGLVITSIASFTKNTAGMKLRFKLKEVRIELQGTSQGPNHHSHNDNKEQSAHPPASVRFPSASEVLRVRRLKADFYGKRRWEALVFIVGAWFVLWLVSAAIFRRSEKSQDWSYFVALYFTFTSLTTIGYGDLYPISNFGKVFFVFWSLLAIPVLTNLVTTMGDIGLRTMTRLSGYIWKLGTSKAPRWLIHRQRTKRRPQGEKGSIGLTDRTLDPESLTGETNSEGHASGPSTAKQPMNNMQIIATLSGTDVGECVLSRSTDKGAQHKLLLAEEIENLIAALRDESITSYDWSRTISLLHARDDVPNALEPHPFTCLDDSAQIAKRKPMSSEIAAADRNIEILWMLKFLSEKLCLDLREELHREA